MKILAFTYVVVVLLVSEACDGLDEKSLKNIIDTVYKAAPDGAKSKQNLFITTIWPEISALFAETVKIPNFRGNVGMNDYIYATGTNIYININDIYYLRYLRLSLGNYIDAVFNADLYFENPVNFVIYKEDSSGLKSKPEHDSFTFKGQNIVKFMLKIPDFSETRDNIPLECIVYIESFDIEFLSEPIIDESKLKDNESKKMVKQFWNIVKQGDFKKMMLIGIMKSFQNKLYSDTSGIISKDTWACLSDKFIDTIYKDVMDHSSDDEDTDEDNEFQDQIEHLPEDKGEDMLYEKINISDFMEAVQHGIDKSISALSSQPKRNIREGDYTNTEVITYTSDMVGMRPGQPTFDFTTYAPAVFRHLRWFLDITDANFVASFCRLPLTELSNPGKSGSGLYLSQDQYFIAKTVKKVESDLLQTFLSKYVNNIHQNVDTLLPKLFGFYKYKQSKMNFRLIVMNNIMPPNVKIDRKYDLKGSLFQREVAQDKKNKPSVTLKDIEFLDHHKQGIFLKAKDYTRLINTIESDCLVLQDYKIIDYSLLLGIHYVNGLKGDVKVSEIDENKLPCEPKSFTKLSGVDKIQNGISAWTARGEKVVLYVGMIDILQNYRLIKRLEHYWKAVRYRGKEFSVVDPEYYAERFKKFMNEKVFKKMLPCPA